MRGYMFRNRWAALLFVGLTLASVTTLIGTGNGDGAIDKATDQIARQKAEADRLTGSSQAPKLPEATTSIEAPFAADEDLIDPATGYDPTPPEEMPAVDPGDPQDIADQVVIVSRDETGEAAAQAPQSTAEQPGQ
ncbi:hypothetical protein GCM10011515_21800 [Tsuneonella deserti]|uniref:Secreted protein n=1 Tax=Tsuneonella deserti TaxID=2035528 RepID=A0ABQ1SCV6_9SPHN|nr:hypothetical protein [Tsuneonella deserti]GGE01762.1 hypothetical protein GCM10011515_21800 [Tsuneonella deserti]